jgi:hypothetical protein
VSISHKYMTAHIVVMSFLPFKNVNFFFVVEMFCLQISREEMVIMRNFCHRFLWSIEGACVR